MDRRTESSGGVTRRGFMATAAIAGVGTTLAPSILRAKPAKWTRWNLSHPGIPPRVLESYKKAITKMLQLPPSDPRNWYRQCLIHTIDCPHGNWWFVPWHRAYIGWFERICRELSGDPDFALPVWDWTIQPQVPDAMYDGVLDPRDPAYVASFNDFQTQYGAAINAMYAGFTQAQNDELAQRGFAANAATLLQVIQSNFFFPRPQARGLQQGQMFDSTTQTAVSAEKIRDSLKPSTFVPFGSYISQNHSMGLQMQGVLESQPHNHVHGAVGGFMGSFMSPTDPVFFLHHANIDRLWDVWTRKQQARGLPTLPTDPTQLMNWQKEPFLFFVDEKGNPVQKNTSGDYATIGDFDYDYERGSGEGEVWAPPVMASRFAGQTFAGDMMADSAAFGAGAAARIATPSDLVEEGIRDDGPLVVARVQVEQPVDAPDTRFQVFVNVPEDASSLGVDSPHHAGSITFFGPPMPGHGPQSFDVPISGALKKLREAGILNPGDPIDVHVVPEARGIAVRAMRPAKVGSVTLAVHQ